MRSILTSGVSWAKEEGGSGEDEAAPDADSALRSYHVDFEKGNVDEVEAALPDSVVDKMGKGRQAIVKVPTLSTPLFTYDPDCSKLAHPPQRHKSHTEAPVLQVMKKTATKTSSPSITITTNDHGLRDALLSETEAPDRRHA